MKAVGMELRQCENDDRRERPRVRLPLKLALVYRQARGRQTPPSYHGRTHDICMSGLSMIVERNIFYEGEFTLLLCLPPCAGAPQKIITATAQMSYAIHSTRLKAYKIGITFLQFDADAEELLEAALVRELNRIEVIGAQRRGLRASATRPRDSQGLR